MRAGQLVAENIKIAAASVRSNSLRTSLTILIIAFGIMALVGIQTAIDSIKTSITDSFSSMGTLTFNITKADGFKLQNEKTRKRGHEYISFGQATLFKKIFSSESTISISTRITGTATVQYGTEKTNPNISIRAVDDDYMNIAGLNVDKGRNFSANEIEAGAGVAIIGIDIVKALFKDNKKTITGEIISVNGVHYRIIGVIESKGSAFGGGPDGSILIPYTNARIFFSRPDISYKIEVKPHDISKMDYVISEAEGLFRRIRRISPADESDFNINRSNSMMENMNQIIGYATIAAIIIGTITLLGAAVGLMNIMLVSVSERTREIGTRKAIGATSAAIRQQFLFESILIGQIGGILGIALGITAGNLIASFVHGAFVIPWFWIFVGVVSCFTVSILSGLIPANRAAKLDPIEALRHE